jgi:aminopeptidase N
MYAEKERGRDTFENVIRQMRRWAMDMSPQGPVYLGYRLGHIRSEGRVFRALVYNKGAMVLHMLRRLLGDEAFFSGLRDFYATWRFKKAGTDDFRVAMEKAAGGRSLARFFERWIYASGTPTLHFTSVIEGNAVRVRFEQKDEIYDVPVTVTVTYADGATEDFVVRVTDRLVEERLEGKGPIRKVEANKDGAALADVAR